MLGEVPVGYCTRLKLQMHVNCVHLEDPASRRHSYHTGMFGLVRPLASRSLRLVLALGSLRDIAATDARLPMAV